MLDPSALDAKFAQIVAGADGMNSVARALAVAYDGYARAAVAAGVDFSAGGDLELLEDAFTSSNSPSDITEMAAKLCLYWQGIPQPGVVAHGGTEVVSVVPAFAGLAAAVQAAIQSCVTTAIVQQPYKRLFIAIEGVLKSSPIVVTELMPTTPPSPTPFAEVIQ